jgi:hypothetical protein
MEARRISVSLRRDPREIAERHSQANPLTLYCELARGEEVTETLARSCIPQERLRPHPLRPLGPLP